jgi:hypothetical protein
MRNRVTKCTWIMSMGGVQSHWSGRPLRLMMESIRSSEMSVLTRSTQRNIQEDDILHCHCHENLKYDTILGTF